MEEIFLGGPETSFFSTILAITPTFSNFDLSIVKTLNIGRAGYRVILGKEVKRSSKLRRFAIYPFLLGQGLLLFGRTPNFPNKMVDAFVY